MSNSDPKKPEEGTEETASSAPRERILSAALELFVNQGYFNTNIPDISRLSKCSVGSIYHHFLNKEEIASQLYRDGLKLFRQALADSLAQDKDLEQNIRALVVAFLRFSESHQQLSQYLWLARHNEFLSAKVIYPTVVGFDALGRKLTKIIREGIRKKEMPDVPAEIFWSIVFGMPLSYMRDWLDGYATRAPSAVAPILADACWSALHGMKSSS